MFHTNVGILYENRSAHRLLLKLQANGGIFVKLVGLDLILEFGSMNDLYVPLGSTCQLSESPTH